MNVERILTVLNKLNKHPLGKGSHPSIKFFSDCSGEIMCRRSNWIFNDLEEMSEVLDAIENEIK